MAGYSVNRISPASSRFTDSLSSDWVGVGTTLSTSALVEKFTGYGSIAAQVTNGDLIVFNRDTTTDLPTDPTCCTTETDVGDTVIAFFWIKTDEIVTVELTCNLIYTVDVGAPYAAASSSEEIKLTTGEWQLVSISSPLEVPDDVYNYGISFNIEFSNIDASPGNANINISAPATYCFFDFLKNPALLDLYRLLPEYVRSQDNQTTIGNWQLARFIEAMIIHQGEIVDLIDSSIYLDISSGKDINDLNTLSTLVNPDVVLRKYTFWLAQFTGTSIINPTTGYTPWGNLPSTWEEIDQIDDDDPVDEESVEWASLEDFNIEPAGLDEFLRWQIKYGFYGYAAGTREALEQSVKRVLTGNKTIGYTVTSVPWEITIATLASETPDSAGVTLNTEMAEIVELLEPSRPLGVKVTHNLQSTI